MKKSEIRKRTDWEQMALEVLALIKRLQKKPVKTLYYFCPGSILKAYREGDLTFKKAVRALETWKKSKTK